MGHAMILGIVRPVSTFCTISFGSKSIVVFLSSFLEEKGPLFPALLFLHLHCLSSPCLVLAHVEISPYLGWWEDTGRPLMLPYWGHGGETFSLPLMFSALEFAD